MTNTLLQSRLHYLEKGRTRALSTADEACNWESSLFCENVSPIYLEQMRKVEQDMITEAESLAGEIYELKRYLQN